MTAAGCHFLPTDHKSLTALFRQLGLLPSGPITSVEVHDTGAFNSRTSRLHLTYSADAPAAAPTRLILKQNTGAEWAKAAGAAEVKFYRLVKPLGEHLPMIPPCYLAEVDPLTGGSCLLLLDLSETHAPPITREDQISIVRGVPSPAHQAAVIDALARFHAYWWDHPLLATGAFEVGYWSRSEERFALYLQRRKGSWEKLLANERAWFPAELVAFYESIFDFLPNFWSSALAGRFSARKHLTLIHGDAYFANFLCPDVPGGQAYLIDWQSPSVDLAGYDLANLLAAFWTRPQRQEGSREHSLLRRYYAALAAAGVQGYTWDDLLADYRAGLAFWVLMPVQDAADGAGKAYWWPKMQCLVDAARDWGFR